MAAKNHQSSVKEGKSSDDLLRGVSLGDHQETLLTALALARVSGTLNFSRPVPARLGTERSCGQSLCECVQSFRSFCNDDCSMPSLERARLHLTPIWLSWTLCVHDLNCRRTKPQDLAFAAVSTTQNGPVVYLISLLSVDTRGPRLAITCSDGTAGGHVVRPVV